MAKVAARAVKRMVMVGSWVVRCWLRWNEL
jgi:hypothetical protein